MLRADAFGLLAGRIPNTANADIPVTEANIENRWWPVFRRLGVMTLGDICQFSRSELASQPGVGKTALKRLTGRLWRYGLQLRFDNASLDAGANGKE